MIACKYQLITLLFCKLSVADPGSEQMAWAGGRVGGGGKKCGRQLSTDIFLNLFLTGVETHALSTLSDPLLAIT